MSAVRYRLRLRIVKLLNVGLLAIPFGICCFLCYTPDFAQSYDAGNHWLIIALFAVLYISYGRIYDAFQISLSRISEVVASQCLAVMIADAIMFLIIWLLTKHFPAVWPMLITFAMQILLSVVWSFLAHQWYFRTFRPRRTAVIYDMREGLDQLISEYGLEKKFQVCATESVETAMLRNLEVLRDVEVVFLCGIPSHERNIILKRCVAQNVQVYLIPRIGDVLMSSAQRMHIFHLPILRVGRYNPAPEYLFVKRTMDIVISGLALLILSPVMAAVAVAIKAADGGPVFYQQCRLTKNGKVFHVLKFRSMRVDAEKDGVARLSSGENDDRITSVGRFIRKCRLDEVPQLFNVLGGSMSLVGPRPERPEISRVYEETLPEFALRLQAKAGLTGYAQVYGKYNTTPYDKLQMDLMYIAHPSVIEDLKIMLATVKILFMSESTEGVEEGQTTAAEQSPERRITI